MENEPQAPKPKIVSELTPQAFDAGIQGILRRSYDLDEDKRYPEPGAPPAQKLYDECLEEARNAGGDVDLARRLYIFRRRTIAGLSLYAQRYSENSGSSIEVMHKEMNAFMAYQMEQHDALLHPNEPSDKSD